MSYVAHKDDGIVLGFGTILIETKVRGGKVAHIEDIVAHPDFRNQRIGFQIVEELLNVARGLGCYKATLHCRDQTTPFYAKCGFETAGTSMHKLFDR